MPRAWDGGYWNRQNIRGLGPRRRLRDCNVEEVAAQFRLDERSALHFDAHGAGKAEARELVLDLFGTERRPGRIRVLSMPGVDWHFECSLLRRREGRGRLHLAPAPELTELHAVENDRAVYYAALLRAPGFSNPGNVVVDRGPTGYAERVLGYMMVERYVFADVDDLVQEDPTVYDCAWLDYFGPLTPRRLDLIRRFMDERVRGTLVVTSLRARWRSEAEAAIRGYADYGDWVRTGLAGYRLEHYVEYCDASPMCQVAVSHPGGFTPAT